MSDPSPPDAAPDPVDAFVSFIEAHVGMLGEIGTPAAIDAGSTLIAAANVMGDALRQAGAVLTAAAGRAGAIH